MQIFLADCKLSNITYKPSCSTGTFGALLLRSEHNKDCCWTSASTAGRQKSHYDDNIKCRQTFMLTAGLLFRVFRHFTRCETRARLQSFCFCIPDSCAGSWGQYFTSKVFCGSCLHLLEPKPAANLVIHLLCHFSHLKKSILSIPTFLKPFS